MSKTIKNGTYRLEVYDNEIPEELENRVSDFFIRQRILCQFLRP